jgi:predicted Ser/Thr protein kinase
MNKNEAEQLYEGKIFLTKGKRGLINTSIDENGKKYCIKEKNPVSEANNRIFLEYENNKKLNEIGVGPKVHFYHDEKDFLVRDFVHGETIFEFIDKNKTSENINKKIKTLLLNILDQCRRMDEIKINKLEMTNPHKDIIVDYKTNNPIIIDFERCKFVARPKNVTQFCQFITKGNMKHTLEELKISLNKENIMHLAETYKKSQNKENYDKIREEIANF